MPKLSTGYVGWGDITETNAASQLDQLLPDQLGAVYVPERITRAQKGLKTATAWLVNELTEAGVFPVDNVIESLLKRQAETADDDDGPDDIALVMVYNPASGVDTGMAQEAHEAGIKVIDLISGDEILFEDSAPPEETPVEAETPPWEPEPAEETVVVPQVSPGPKDIVDAAAKAGLAAAQAVQERQEVPVLTGLSVIINIPAEALDALAQLIVDRMQGPAEVVEVAAAPSIDTDDDTDTGPVGVVAGDNDQPEGTTPWYYNTTTDRYRKARARKRDEEVRTFLTPAQVEEVTSLGLVG